MTEETESQPEELIRDFDELLAQLDCASEVELIDLVESVCRADLGELIIEILYDPVSFGLSISCWGPLGGLGDDLGFPFRVSDFWRMVREIEQFLLRRFEAQRLPDADSFTTSSALILELSQFLDLTPETNLVDYIGGGWHPVSEQQLMGHTEPMQCCYGTGDPLRALMGFGGEEAIVAVPIWNAGGNDGPPSLEQGTTFYVSLRTETTMVELREAVATAISEVIAG